MYMYEDEDRNNICSVIPTTQSARQQTTLVGYKSQEETIMGVMMDTSRSTDSSNKAVHVHMLSCLFH